MKKQLFTIALMIIMTAGYSQVACEGPDVINPTPAPCSIEAPNTYAVYRWKIQVGVYSELIYSFENVHAVPFYDSKGNIWYRYYLNELFYSAEQAAARAETERLKAQQGEGPFCDAYHVRINEVLFVKGKV